MSQIVLDILAQTDKATKSIDRFSKNTEKQLGSVEKSFSSISKVAKVAAAGALAFFAGRRIISGVKTAVGNAKAYEEVLSQLNTQLKLSGTFSDAASRDYEAFASQIQRTTRFGDDAALSVLALAERFGLSGQRAKDFTQAAAELAQMTGQSLDTAARQLSQTLTGQAGTIARLIPGVRELTSEQLKNGEVIKLLNDQYGGTALAATKTYAGAVDQLEKAQADLSKELGFLITKNPIVIESIDLLAKAFANAADFVAKNQDLIISLSKQILDRGKKSFDVLRKSIEGIDFANLAVSIRNVAVAFGLMWASLASAKAIKAFVALTALDKSLALLASGKKIGAVVKSIGLLAGKFLIKAAAISAAVIAVDLLIRNFSLLRTGISRITNAGEIDRLNAQLKELEKVAQGTQVGVSSISVLGFSQFSKSAEEAAKEAEKIRERLEELTATRDELVEAFDEKVDLGLFQQIQDGLKGLVDGAKELIDVGIFEGFDFSVEEKLDVQVQAERQQGTLERILQSIKDGITVENFGKGAGKFFTALAAGADGARALLREGAVAAGSILGPGFGQAAGAIFDIVTQSPDQIRDLVNGFVDEIPVIIDALVEGVPILIEALAERADDIIIALIEAIPKVAEALVKSVFVLLEVVLGNAVRELSNVLGFFGRVIDTAVTGFQRFFDAFSGLGDVFQRIAKGFNDFISIFTRLIDSIKDVGKSLDPTRGGFFRELGRGDFSAIGRRLGFAGGLTEVPPGFPRDSFPANLTSGERVVDAETNRDLKQFLAQARSGAGSREPIIVTLQLGREELARTILDLDRDGFELRAT